jgi:glycosyltransferase involved in cell wall biosynthesis
MDTVMRLLIATPLYPPDSGGPATYTKLLHDHLSKKGDSMVLVKFGEVRHLPKIIRHITYFINVLRAGKKVDVILALDPVSTGLPALLAARFLGKAFVVKIVGDFAWEQGTQRFGVMETLDEFVKREKTPFAVACLRVVQTYVARSATRIIVPSDYLKGIVTRWSSKISVEKISVIYNSIELPEDVQKQGAKVAEYPTILSAGRLVPWKGMEGLIDAVEEIQKKHQEVKLVIVGDGPDKKLLDEKAAKQLGHRAVFTGQLSHLETLNAMQTSTVYVQNSSYEGLSHQLIEALMLGKAIVATSVGGNPELIQDSENGLLVPFGDTEALIVAIEKILEDGELRARLGARAKETSIRFALSIMIEQTHKLLSSL